MTYWINTYHPLDATPTGPWARHDPPLPPFVDASCRREPDFEATRPALTGLCRTAAVKRFRVNDVVAYFTTKYRNPGQVYQRRLTAVLRAIHELPSHFQADQWYRGNGFGLPRNIMVPSNPPLPLDATEGGYRDANKKIVPPRSPEDAQRVLDYWDSTYEDRRCKVGHVRICDPLLVNVWSAPVFSDEMVREVFGSRGFPETRYRPAEISRDEMIALLTAIGNGASARDERQ
jgi:hypothetical protein